MTTGKRVAPVALRLAFGLGIMVIGLLLTLDNFGLLDAHRFVRFWPVLLIVAGVAKLTHRLKAKARTAGYLLIVLGLVLLLVNMHLIELRLAAALFLLALGAAIAWRAARTPAPACVTPVMDPSRHLDVSVFMAGVKRALSTQDFRGGNAWAVMGGCEIDLTRTSILDDEAVVNVFAFWGGIEIRVPADWMVESRGTAVLGAFEDTSLRPGDERKKLIVTGTAIMGGVEVKN